MSDTNAADLPEISVAPGQQPRRQLLARTLIKDIETGVYPVGQKLPREVDLCVQFGASRHTVRAALDSLVRMGLIQRTQRLGTVVKARSASREYQLKLRQFSDLMQFSHDTRMEILLTELRTIDETVESALLPYEGQKWLYVRGLRHSETHASPISFHEVWVHPDYRSVEGITGFVRRSVVEAIEHQFGVMAVKVKQVFRSLNADLRISEHLNVPEGASCLWVERQYYDDKQRLIELSLSVHPGDLFSYEMELERSSPERQARSKESC